jgi:hypothetical protein
MNSLSVVLYDLPESLWFDLKQVSVGQNKWDLRDEWWHNKYYKRNPPNDGFSEQISERGDKETPYRRNLFYPSPHGRFSLGEKPVAYFSSNFGINCCETIEQFRSNEELSWEGLEPYFKGNQDPSPDLMGYPISVKISEQAIIVDLAKPSDPLFNAIAEVGTWSSSQEFFDSVILSRNKQAYRDTQLLAIEAHRHGFDGMVYKSVRAPKDICLPDWNLVMFDESLVERK